MPGTSIAEAALTPTRARFRQLAARLGLLALAVLAATQFVGAYLYLEFPYVNIYRLERGYERLPFQTRLLVVPLYRWVDGNRFMVAYASRLARNTYFFPRGVFPGDVLEFFMDIPCVLFAGWVATRIYRAASRRHLLQPLVFPIFLGFCILAYILHTVQNFRYPYDMPSLAFFAAGFYLIYFRKPVLWFVALFAVATLNRETSLLLLPFFALSQAVHRAQPPHPSAQTPHPSAQTHPSGQTKHGGQTEHALHWRALLAPSTLAVLLALTAYWALWHHIVYALFAHNASEYYPRAAFNLRTFARLRYYPQLASGLGFMAPFLFLGRRFVRDPQLRAWLWMLPVWYAFMFTWAILVETRVFGELIPFLTVYTAILAEEWLAARLLAAAHPADHLALVAPADPARRAA
jgi:hypothetical protein